MCVRTNWDICVHTLYVCTDIHNLICTHWRRHLWAGTFVKREVNNSTRLFLCASAFVFYGKKNKKQRWGQRRRQRPRQRQRQRRAKQVAKRVNGGRRSKDGDADEQRQQREKDRKRELGRQREKESGDGKQARRQQVAWRFSLPVCGGLQTHIHAHMHRAERKRDPHMHTRQHIISYTYRQTYVNGETTAKQTTTKKQQQQQQQQNARRLLSPSPNLWAFRFSLLHFALCSFSFSLLFLLLFNFISFRSVSFWGEGRNRRWKQKSMWKNRIGNSGKAKA